MPTLRDTTRHPAHACSIWAIASSDPTCSVLLAAHGEGASVLERNTIRQLGLDAAAARAAAAATLVIGDAGAATAQVRL